MADVDSFGQYIQVVVDITGVSDSQVLSIDHWDNCPFEVAKEEGQYCNQCEFWGREVRGIDWAEFSLCCFKDKP